MYDVKKNKQEVKLVNDNQNITRKQTLSRKNSFYFYWSHFAEEDELDLDKKGGKKTQQGELKGYLYVQINYPI